MSVIDKLVGRYEPILDNSSEFRSSMQTRLPFSFRVNTLKSTPSKVVHSLSEQGINVNNVPWSKTAFTSDKPVGKTPEYLSGEIYIQELSSMLPPLAMVKELVLSMDSVYMVLDACAAPGSKTTQMAALMENRGCIVANDQSYGRTRALRFNLEKYSVENTVITNYDLRRFPLGRVKVMPLNAGRLSELFVLPEPKFDAVFLDAPCSGEGTMMDNPKSLQMWSEKRIRTLSRLQKELIIKAFSILRPGGVMIYSTCTFAPEENEMVVGYLLENTEATLERVNLPGMEFSPGLTKWKKLDLNPDLSKCCRVWPHKNKGMGGFFLAKIRK